MSRFRPWLLSLFVLAILPARGFAQQQTTATYEDWTVRCAASGKPNEKFCDLEQLSYLKGSGKPFSRIVLSRPAKGEPLRLIVQVPANVWLATPVKIEVGGKDSALAGSFARCMPAGCFATLALNDDILKAFRTTKAPVRIVYANADKSEVVIPIPLKGFSQAFNALTEK